MEIVFKLNRKEDVIKIAKKAKKKTERKNRHRELLDKKKKKKPAEPSIPFIVCIIFYFSLTFPSLSLSLAQHFKHIYKAHRLGLVYLLERSQYLCVFCSRECEYVCAFGYIVVCNVPICVHNGIY